MDRKWGIRQYLWALIRKATFIALLIIDLISFALLGHQIPIVVYPLVLVLGTLISGYQVYSDLNKEIEALNKTIRSLQGGPPRLVLSPKSVQFGGHGWQNRMPTPPLRFLATLDLRNPSDQLATLQEIAVTRISTPSSLIPDWATIVNLYPSGSARRGQSAPLPLPIPPCEWKPKFLCEAQVELTEKDPHKFAQRLHELSSFSLVFAYSYEFITGISTTEELTVSGDFSQFRQDVIDHWRESKDQDLLDATAAA